MLIPLSLLGLAIASSIAYALGKGTGLGALIVLLVLAAVICYMQSSNALMGIAYGLAFGWPILLGTIALGAFAGALFRRGKYLLAPLAFLPFLFFGWTSVRTENNAAAEQDMVQKFVSTHRELEQLLNGPVQANLSTLTSYSDKSKGTYEFSIRGSSQLFAIVSVDRSGATPQIRLECVTTVYMGHRDARASACDQGIVPLDGSTAVTVENEPDSNASAPTAMPASNGPAPRAFLPRFSADTQVHVIGIRESENAVTSQGTQQSKGRVMVDVPYSKTPLVLVLASHESVQWVINDHGRPISAVLLSGHPLSTVAGVYGGHVAIGNRHAHEADSPEYLKLKELVIRNTRLPTVQFQGAQTGAAFTVPPN